MDTTKIILLYYKYVDIANPSEILSWQKSLCSSLRLKGRIILAHEGINGTISGTVDNIQAYKRAMETHLLFGGIDFKESLTTADPFPRMRIGIKKEIVHLGIDPLHIKAEQGGKHLTPEQVHTLLNNKPDNLVVLDCRNSYESNIGHFRDALIPNTKYFREFPDYVHNNRDLFEQKQVLMYCTGGVRCERASAFLKQATNAQEVYQIQGGIHQYIQAFPDGHFRGKNYVFDDRIQVAVNDDVLGTCFICKTKWDAYTNCWNVSCNAHVILCTDCINKYENSCSISCHELLQTKQVRSRMEFHKNKRTASSS